MNSPFDQSTAAAALQAHARLAGSGRKVEAGQAAALAAPEDGDYKRMTCQGQDAGLGLFSGLHGMVREYQRMPCPDCGNPCLIRTSRQMSQLTREYYYACINPECGGTYGATMEINRRISPSATPNPKVDLPVSQHVRRDVIRAQMDYARTAAQPLLSTAPALPVTGGLFDRPPPG